MFFNDRQSAREFFIQVWNKHRESSPLEPLESMLLDIILEHPEYHHHLEQVESVSRDYDDDPAQENPYLHMGLHMAVREQLQTDRPAGIVKIYRSISDNSVHKHEIEHKIMAVLAEFLWQAQRDGVPPDEKLYLQELGKLGK